MDDFSKQSEIMRSLAQLSTSDKDRVRKIAADLLAGKVAKGEVDPRNRGTMSREAGNCLLDALEALHAVDRFIAG